MAPHDHYVQFYETAQFLCEAVSRFVHEGFTSSTPVVLIAVREHSEAVRHRLSAAGYNYDRAVRDGDIVCLDAHDALGTFMINGMPDEHLFMRQIGGVLDQVLRGRGNQQIFTYGEMVDVLWQQGNSEAAHELEAMWNRLRDKYNFVLLCGYALSNFGDEASAGGLAEVCRAHSHVVPAESYTPQAPTETRAREIVMLQQRVRALESELARFRQVELQH